MSEKDCNDTFDVSIGICVKDSERTIKEAIESLLNQSFNQKQMEIIVVDDGCKDKTIPIIVKILKKTDILFRIFSTNGGGLTMARQMVIDSSCSPLVIFMDGDMVFTADFVQKQVELMEKNPSLGVVQGTMIGRKNRGLVSELEDLSFSSAFEIGIHRNWRRNPQALGTGGSAFRVIAVKAAGGFDTRIKGAAEDADLTKKIKSKGYSLAISEAKFEHEFKRNLKSLWKQYTWYGFGMHYYYHKHGNIGEMALVYFWPVSYTWGLIRSVLVFRATKRKIAFFLPSYNFFRATAWWFGFLDGHLKGYGHE
jgi:glycosyltransferase involved in cell wall biosynthesis